MSWLDELRPAEFRGVKFYVHAADTKGGRTTVTHSVPGSNKRPFKEDLGSEGRGHAVEAYVFGDDYQAELRKLIDAIDQGTPAQLNHPFLGVALCIVEGEFSVRQSGDEGGFAVVSVTFSETAEATPAPSAISTDATSALAAMVKRVKAAAAAAFAAQVQLESQLSDGITGVGFFAANELLGQVGAQLEAALSKVAVPGEMLAQFQRQLAAPVVRAADFVENPAGFFPALLESLFDAATSALVDSASLVAQPVTVLLSLTDAVQVADDADEETQAIAPTLSLLVQRGALCAAADVLPLQQFDAYETAVAGRQAVIDAINKHSAAAADDTYADFVDLRGAVARAVPSADSNLPRLQQYTPAVGVPSLVLAHRLYGDVDAEADIVARNRIPNPAFILGGRPLEVLGRG